MGIDKDHEENSSSNSQEKPKVEVLIVRHKELFEMLKNPHAMWRVLLSLFCIIVIFFIGLAFVVLAVKKFYPYNSIQTNIYGATIMKNEDKEVIYWLFNTAELWANSGISVKKGDILTIRASGASNTAIHHLVDNSRSNTVNRDKWVDTDGQRKTNNRDMLRANFRINKNQDEGKLLMQIIPYSNQKTGPKWLASTDNPYLKGDSKSIIVVGKERQNIRIPCDGVLHFAVNDIVLTDDVLDSLFVEDFENLKNEIKSENGKISLSKEEALKAFKTGDKNKLEKIEQNILNENKVLWSSIKKNYKEHGFNFGIYADKNDKDSVVLINELLYYKENKFVDAWFVDNIGSFLIVIERQK